MIIGGKQFDTTRQVYLMGILNVTPDSFSDGGRYDRLDRALYHAEEMIKNGADLIDVGGESTRPNYVKLSTQEEIDRVAPVLEALKARFDVPLSLDSYKSEVIAANLSHIDLVNDIWGLKHDPQMATLIAKAKLPCCLMHNRPTHDYRVFWNDFLEDVRESLRIALDAGIRREDILLDGGVGFQKNAEENLTVIHRTDALCALGCPVLLAVSRKSVIGAVLDQTVEERLYGTLAAAAVAVTKGASFLRVHDVAEHRDLIRMMKAIEEERLWTASE